MDKGLKFMAEREKDWAVSADAAPASGSGTARAGLAEAERTEFFTFTASVAALTSCISLSLFFSSRIADATLIFFFVHLQVIDQCCPTFFKMQAKLYNDQVKMIHLLQNSSRCF